MMKKDSKIYVAGHKGMVGSAIVRELQRQGYTNIITRSHKELDLICQDAVNVFLQKKSRNMFSSLLPKLVVSLQIKIIWRILCMII